VPERRARPVQPAVQPVRARTTPAPRVDRPTRFLAATPGSSRTIERRSKATPAVVVVEPVAARRLTPRSRAGPRLEVYEGVPVRPAAVPEEHVRDNRLLLQLGVLAALLYLACLAGWYSAATLRRRRA
jgi:hypothetical protein